MKCCWIFMVMTLFLDSNILAQNNVQGVVHDGKGRPLADVNIGLTATDRTYKTNSDGSFDIVFAEGEIAVFSRIGYRTEKIRLTVERSDLIVVLQDSATAIQTVEINTGYFRLPKERSTGSYGIISSEIVERNNSLSVLDRMEGVVDGLTFDKRTVGVETSQKQPDLRLRGLGTIFSSTSPLVIVNDFPYEGDLEDLNPDEIENIVFLKDGAASSIWGARAGNGVIVITLKKNRLQDKLKIDFKSTYALSAKPDLYYNRRYLESKHMIGFEKELFEKGFTIDDPVSPLSPVAELLFAHKKGEISAETRDRELSILEGYDIRQDAEQKLYRSNFVQQQHLKVSGGVGNNYVFSHALTYNGNSQQLIGNSRSNIALYSNNSFSIGKSLTLEANVMMGRRFEHNDGIGIYSNTATGSAIFYPYSQLGTQGAYGASKPIYRVSYMDDMMEEGLLDWRYYPLQEIQTNRDHKKDRDMNFSTALSYRLNEWSKLHVAYNFQDYLEDRERFLDRNSFYVRNLVNRFTQTDGEQIFPHGDILENTQSVRNSHTGRVQVSLDKQLAPHGRLSAVAGMEIRQSRYINMPGVRLVGMDYNYLTANNAIDYAGYYATRPYGFYERIEPMPNWMADITDRFVSYYLNANYQLTSYLDISASSRWDASNLFGVDFNKKGVPLWSSGIKYRFPTDEYNRFSARLTYGVSGNVNESASARPIVVYGINQELGLKTATLTNPGNANLGWEKTKITNAGIDFDLFNTITGSIDGYVKNNVNLIGSPMADPTSGISTTGGAGGYMEYLINYANLKSYGVDLNVRMSKEIFGIPYQGNVIFSYARNKITKYMSNEPTTVLPYLDSYSPLPVEGSSRDVLYSIPWNGLSSANGLPMVYINGIESQEYASYFNGLSHGDLKAEGTSVPLYWGGFRNTFRIPALDIDFSFNLTWKAGYKVRRRSLEYVPLFNNLVGHMDYVNRWAVPGDELKTDIPAISDAPNTMMDNVYKYAEILVVDGSHIRLNDIQISYRKKIGDKTPQSRFVRFNLMASNLGILWKSDKQIGDPDFPSAQYRPSRSISLSVTLTL